MSHSILAYIHFTLVSNIESDVCDVRRERVNAPVSPSFDVHPRPHNCHVQIRRQQKPAKDILSHIHGQT